MKDSDTAEKLAALRYTLGLSVTQMADEIGISYQTYKYYENGGSGSQRSAIKRKINSFLDEHDFDFKAANKARILELQEQELLQRQMALQHHFVQGHLYRFVPKGYDHNHHAKGFQSGTTWESDCVFIYLRKDGKHHVFKELHGGWTRTYTDPQLIGKNIIEVSE